MGAISPFCACGNPRRPGQKTCIACHAEYNRTWRGRRGGRKNYLSPEAVRRANARAYLHVYIRRGKIQRGPCMEPGCTNPVQAHHPDYSKPLEVFWVCKEHHNEIHRLMKAIP